MKHVPSTQTDFVIEREFSATPEEVFQAWADPDAKRRWSDCHAEFTTNYQLDFRPLGRETHEVVYPDGRVQLIEKVFSTSCRRGASSSPTTSGSTHADCRSRS